MMHFTFSRAIAALVVGVALTAVGARAQEPAATPALPTLAVVEIPSIEALFEDVRESLRVAAEAGDSAASLAMARSLFGDPDPEKQAQGIGYLEGAAEAGARDAIEQLGDLYANGGYGLAPDPAKARETYERAVKAGSLQALASLGQLLLNTDFSADGQKRGLEMLEQAAEAGQVTAATRLAEIYLGGLGVEPDVDKAMHFYGVGLINGSPGAILGVGDALRTGTRQLATNPKVAMDLFQRAADSGDKGAARRIASMYLNGEAVAQDVVRAEQMLTELANAGDAQSFVDLGDLYRDGTFVAADIPKAVGFYEKAAALNFNAGTTRLAALYLAGAPGVPIDVRRSLDYYNEAVERGSAGAMRSMADLYLAGTILTPDPQQAIDLLERAATFGDSASAERLATIYAQNDPFPADYDQVKKYLDLAMAMGNTRAVLDVATAIAEGPLARTQRDASFELLSGAVSSGIPGASARLARLQLDGVFPAQGLSGVMTMLNDAARKGDQPAARFLLELYRDGHGLLLQPDLRAAEAFLTTIEPVLGAEGTAIERIGLAVKQGDNIETLQEISEQFDKLSRASVADSLNDLRRQSARAYVYVLQRRLQALGLYDGTLNGTLDGVTIRAFQEACREADAVQACAPGPLTAGTARVLADFVWSSQV
jgi:TPR repeat protein